MYLPRALSTNIHTISAKLAMLYYMYSPRALSTNIHNISAKLAMCVLHVFT